MQVGRRRGREGLSQFLYNFVGFKTPKLFLVGESGSQTVNGSDHELWAHKSAENSEKWDNTIYVFFTYFWKSMRIWDMKLHTLELISCMWMLNGSDYELRGHKSAVNLENWIRLFLHFSHISKNPWGFKIWESTSEGSTILREFWTISIIKWGPTKVRKIRKMRLRCLHFSQKIERPRVTQTRASLTLTLKMPSFVPI